MIVVSTILSAYHVVMRPIAGGEMELRERILNVLLWYSIFAWGTWFGGTLYQMSVVVPMWSSSPPESVRAFFLGTQYNQTIFHFFGPPFMAARVIPIIVALALAWHLPRHRAAIGVAVVCLLAAVVFTIAFVYPINAVLFAQAGGDLPAADIAALVRTWIWADRIRLVVGVVAFVALLRAFRMPLPPHIRARSADSDHST
jgi:uncharacterized membrane protein